MNTLNNGEALKIKKREERERESLAQRARVRNRKEST
jgi:hypothetical protein